MQHAEFPQKGQHLTKDTAFVSHYLWHPQLVPEGVITQITFIISRCVISQWTVSDSCLGSDPVEYFSTWAVQLVFSWASCLLESQVMHPSAWLDWGTGVNWCHSSEILEQHWFTLTGNAALGLWTKTICHCRSYMTCYDKLWHLLRQVFTCNNFKWYKPTANHLLWQWTKHYCTACTDLIIHQMYDNI